MDTYSAEGVVSVNTRFEATTPQIESEAWSGEMTISFVAGDKVRVSEDFFWAKGATGAVSAPPGEITALSGPWDGDITRRETSSLGVNTVYWVWFDEPQFDADGDGPYRAGSIWESALTRID